MVDNVMGGNINPRILIQKKIIVGVDDPEEQIGANGIDLRINESVTLKPLSFKNVEIMERFNMEGCFGVIFIRSSLSRKAVFHSAGLFDDGFANRSLPGGGCVGGISLYNLGTDTITIKKGERICQIVCWPSNCGKKYNGHYKTAVSIESQFDIKSITKPKKIAE